MLKFGVSLRIILTIALFAFPVWRLAFFLLKKILKGSGYVLSKIYSFGALYRMKNKMMEQWAAEVEDEKDDLKKKLSFDKNLPLFSANELFKWPHKLDKEGNIKKKKILEKIIYEALVLRKEWKLEEYEKKVIEWLAIQSDNKDLNKLLADFYFSIGNHKKALSLLKRIIETDPHDHKAIRQIGEIYLITGDFETAELLIEKAIAINSSNPKYYMSMVELLYNTERKREAVDVMEKVVKLRPTVSSYLLTLADLYNELGDSDNAKKNYFRVLEYEPSNEKAKKKLKNLAAI